MRTRLRFTLIAALLLILLISAGALLYFSGQKKTPEYSLNLLNNAIKQHDLATFEKHFELNTFYAQAFDDVIAPTLRQPSDSGLNDFLAAIMAGVRQSFADSMSEQTKRYVETGTLDLDNNAPEQILAGKFTELTDFRNMNFKKVQSVKVDGSTAHAEVLVNRKQIKEDLVLKLKMRRLEDETWSVVGMENLQEFLASMSAKKAEKLSVLNKPLAKKLAERIAITSSKFEHKKNNRFGVSYAFSFSPTVEFKDVQVAEFAGQVDVFNKNGEKLFSQKFVSSGPFPIASKQEFRFSWSLNPFVPNEKTLIATPGRELSVKTEIIRARFVDGSEIKLLETMPGSE